MNQFITLEGLDFSGKSTALNRIKDQLPQGTIFTREPGGTPKSEQIRKVLTTTSQQLTGLEKLNLFFDARYDHVEKVIDPNIKAGHLVISDRYVGSTYAYQVAGDKLSFDIVDQKAKDLFNKFPTSKPDLTIYFQISSDIRKQRIGLRSQDDLDKYDEDFYKRVEKEYLKGINASAKQVIILDANGAPEETANKLLNIILDFTKDTEHGSN